MVDPTPNTLLRSSRAKSTPPPPPTPAATSFGKSPSAADKKKQVSN